MFPDVPPRSLPFTERARLAWLEAIWDRLCGRRRCEWPAALKRDASLSTRSVDDDLHAIVHTIVGRTLTRTVMNRDHARQSLTDMLARGANQATRLQPHVHADDTVLEYGGGVGRIGRAVAPHVRHLVSVDVNPLMTEYGRRISPEVEFVDLDALPETPQFDGAYCIAVFFHLSLEQQRAALEYVHRRLKPGGWFLVDVLIGPVTATTPPSPDDVHETSADDFRALYEPMFTAKRLPLFNAGFLLRKKDALATPAPIASGYYAVNESSVVADVLEGEVVVVNLDNGAYYILQGSASAIWQLIAAGRHIDEITTVAARHAAQGTAKVPAALRDFVRQLEEESLIVPAAASAAGAATADDDRLFAGQPFAPPVMWPSSDPKAVVAGGIFGIWPKRSAAAKRPAINPIAALST